MLFPAFSRRNSQPLGEQELKFHVPGHASSAVRRWLAAAFRPHGKHAVSTICSIYFDSRSGQSFREKEASDFRKTKYRIRWYADSSGRASEHPAYLEIKEKHGAARVKRRVPLSVPAARIAEMPLTDQWFTSIFGRATAEGRAAPEQDLRPVLELRYERHRYAHAAFTETFCLDSNIRCTRTHPACLPQAHGRPLDHGVFEQKGAAQQPLPVLQALPRFGARRASISKYFLAILQLQPHSEIA